MLREQAICAHAVSVAAQPGLSELAVSELGLSELGLSELGLSELGLSELGLSELGLSELGLSELGLSEPSLSEPSLSELGLSEPSLSEPAVDVESGLGTESVAGPGSIAEPETTTGFDVDAGLEPGRRNESLPGGWTSSRPRRTPPRPIVKCRPDQRRTKSARWRRPESARRSRLRMPGRERGFLQFSMLDNRRCTGQYPRAAGTIRTDFHGGQRNTLSGPEAS
jgi:hypothetical protein